MAGQRRILATSVAGLQAAVDAAVDRFGATITGTVLTAVRSQVGQLVADAVAELPTGGGAVFRSAVVDLGTTPRREHWTRIEDPEIHGGTVVLGSIGPYAPGKPDDEPGMDIIDVWCVPHDGYADVRVSGLTGRIARQFRIDYLISEA